MSYPQIRIIGPLKAEANFRSHFKAHTSLVHAEPHPLGSRLVFQLNSDDLQPSQLRQWADEHHADAFMLEEPKSIKLAFFDMDSTLIQAEVIDELAREANVLQEVSELTARAMQGELDFNQSFSARMALLKGLSIEVVEQVYQRIELMPGAKEVMESLNQAGIHSWILSGGFDVFAKRFAQHLGMSGVVANSLDVVDGVLTGRTQAPIINAEAKAAHLIMLAEQSNCPLTNCLAVGDGANDLKMLATAGMGVALHAKPAVRQQAQYCIDHATLADLPWLLGLPTTK